MYSNTLSERLERSSIFFAMKTPHNLTLGTLGTVHRMTMETISGAKNATKSDGHNKAYVYLWEEDRA